MKRRYELSGYGVSKMTAEEADECNKRLHKAGHHERWVLQPDPPPISSVIILGLGRVIGSTVKFLSNCLLFGVFIWLLFTHPLLALAVIALCFVIVALKGIIGSLVSIDKNLAALVEVKKKEDDQ